MDGYEYKINATYNKNMLYFQKEQPHIYEKISNSPKGLSEYKIVYHKTYDADHFNIQHIESGKFFYDKDPSILSEEFLSISNDSRDFFVTTISGHITNKMSVSIDDYDKIIDYIQINQNKKERERLDPHKLVFLGAGLGRHIEDSSRKISTLRVILVIEPNLELFKISTMFVDYEDISKRQLLYISSDDNEDEMYYRYRQLESPFASYNFSIKFHFFNQTYRQYLAPIVKRFMTTNIYELSFEHFLSKDYNKYHNLFTYPVLDFTRTKVIKNTPIMLIMSGPSLDDNIDFLKRVQNKFLFVTVGSALFKLYQNDIVPDICFAMDGKKRKIEEFSCLSSEYIEKIQFFIADLVDPDVSNMINPIITFGRAQRTVGHHALASLCELGFSSIWTIGNDVCVSNKGKEYASNLPFKEKIETEEGSKTAMNYDKTTPAKGNFRDVVQSKMKFLSYVRTYEGMKDAFFYDINVYNLSDGAFIEGMTPLRPEDLDINAFDDIENKSSCISIKNMEITKTNIENVDYDKNIEVIYDLRDKVNAFEKQNIPNKRLDEYLYFRDSYFMGDFAVKARESNIVNESIIRYIMFSDNSILNFFDNKKISTQSFEKHFDYIFDLYIKGLKGVLQSLEDTLIYAKDNFALLGEKENDLLVYIIMRDDEYMNFVRMKHSLEEESEKRLRVMPIIKGDIGIDKKSLAFLSPLLSDFKGTSVVLDVSTHFQMSFNIEKIINEIGEDMSLCFDEANNIYVFNNEKNTNLTLEYVEKIQKVSIKDVKGKIKNIEIEISQSSMSKKTLFKTKEKNINVVHGSMPRIDASLVCLYCVDSTSFKKSGENILQAISKNSQIKDVHFHCLNTFGTNKKDNQEFMSSITDTFTDINITLSYENKMLRNTRKDYPVAYFKCMSYFVLEDLLANTKADIFHLNTSSLVFGDLLKIKGNKSDVSYYIGEEEDSFILSFYKNNKINKKLAKNLKIASFYELENQHQSDLSSFKDIFHKNIKNLSKNIKASLLDEEYRDKECSNSSYIWMQDSKRDSFRKYQYEYSRLATIGHKKQQTKDISTISISNSNSDTMSSVSASKLQNNYYRYSGYVDISFIDDRGAVLLLNNNDDDMALSLLWNKRHNKTALSLWCILSKRVSIGSIYDLGAGSGAYSIASHFFCSKVISLERDLFLYSRMSVNLSVNNIDNYHTYFMSIGDKKTFSYKNDKNILDNEIKSSQIKLCDLSKNIQSPISLLRVSGGFSVDIDSFEEINMLCPDILVDGYVESDWKRLNSSYALWDISEKNNSIAKGNSGEMVLFSIKNKDEMINLFKGVLNVE